MHLLHTHGARPCRAWTELGLPCDRRDHELFAASTVVWIGNGKTARFWSSSWMNGSALKSLAPGLYKKSKRKKLSVYKALKRNRWITHILPLQSPQEIHEYVRLWEMLKDVQLVEDQEDTIRWRWTANGDYTIKSAYHIQFEGCYSKLKLSPIWRAKPRCRFFAWTLMHRKILTANNLAKRNWPNDPICKLCGTEPETPNHLCKDCHFTQQVWSRLIRWFNPTVLNSVGSTGSTHSYWRRCWAKFDKTERRRVDGIMIYLWWNVWKERNRRTFQQKSLTPDQVAHLCKNDIYQFEHATTPARREE
jgi:hypothetical protein